MGTQSHLRHYTANQPSTRTTEVAGLLAQLARLLAVDQPRETPDPTTPAMPTRVLLTVEEAAESLGIGKTKTYSLVMAGEIASVQIGRLRRVHIDSVREYAARLVADQTTVRTQLRRG
ncbi:helix-turn-helix domain-containing protein [Pseudonocardia sp. Cha107L01]|uniref:helix-turn-helix domain-containing protein n=1 Tax=Pseudonocardia sp. Cha107L01 TaxID=3457576 RepID=UPI00403E8396